MWYFYLSSLSLFVEIKALLGLCYKKKYMYNVGLKTLLQQDISEPEFYGNLVYRFRKKYGKI